MSLRSCGVGAEGASGSCGVGVEGVSDGGGGEVASASKSFTHTSMSSSATPPVSPSPSPLAHSLARTKISENNVVNNTFMPLKKENIYFLLVW